MKHSVAEKYALPLALCLILLGALRIAITYRELSLTTDEPFYLTRGLQLLTAQPLDKTEHPPLAQWAAALLPYWMGARLDPQQGIRPLFLPRPGRPDPWRIVAAMRVGVLPFFILASLVVFWGARWYFGGTVALVSLALFTLIPSVLAHAGLATTDMALTATLSAAFFLLLWWADTPSPVRALILGAAAALAVLSKFSVLVYLPAAAALALLSTLATRRPALTELLRTARNRIPGLLLALTVGALIVWAAYGFTVSELSAEIRAVAAHNAAGHDAFLLGAHRSTGWWYFFPVALAVKTPIALLLLAAAGLGPAWSMRRTGGLIPLALCLGILLPAMAARINLGVRHILPVYAGLSILAGLGAVRLAQWNRILPLLLIAWLAFSGARAHPDYLAYFNELAGDRPDRILVDSDLDWRQDLVLVALRLRHHQAPSISLDLDPWAFPNADIYQSFYGLPPVLPESPTPAPGWHAIGLTPLHLTPAANPWYDRARPVERIGGTLLFHVP
jgi:4-amino-4-deoxy-L-arabinose transferase-like glycosyltransferase